MKKFYSMALALTVVASAMAAPQLRQIQPKMAKSHATVSLSEGQMKKMSATKVKSFAGEENSIEGYYNLTLGDYYFQGGAGETSAEVNVTLEGTSFIMTSDSRYFPSDVVGTFNASTNKVTFNAIEMGSATIQGQSYYIKFAPFEWQMISAQEGNLVETPVVGTYNPSAGTITFPSDHGLCWKAYSSSDYSEANFAGYVEAWDIISMEKGVNPDSGWTTVTEKAKWMDRMVGPMFFENYEAVEREITVQQNDEDPNLYRMVAPFESYIMGKANIVLDTTNAANVLIELQSTGISAGELGECYIASTSEVLADPSKGNLITKNGDRIEFPTKSIWLYFPSYAQESVFYNTDQTEPGYLIITGGVGVEDITIDANAPVEYYNMQGMRVANPEKGQLVIARQGEKAVKMIVK